MRVIVTGACGLLGRAVVGALRDRGVDVRGVDKDGARAREQGWPQADLSDLGQVVGALSGADAVVHLAAIPSPLGHTPDVVYRNNVLTDFNVFEAAALLGMRRVVYASSVSALGFPYQHRWSEPLYVPIDEDHPLLPQDAYGLSKATGELTAAAYSRRGGGSAFSLRFSTIVAEHSYEQVIARAQRDPGASAHLLWSYVDLRDAARACVLAVDAPGDGHAALYITAADTTVDVPTDTLVSRHFPAVPRRPRGDEASDRWSLLDGARARDALGYRPAYAWRQVLAGLRSADTPETP